jgi:hypothetical protein
MATNRSDPVTYAEAIDERLDGIKTPPELKKLVASFRAAFTAYQTAATVTEKAREARDAALAAVAKADDVLDPSVDALATALVGATLTQRARPFLGFSTYAPGDLQDAAYAIEVKEVEKLVVAVGKKKPPPTVAKAAALASKNAKAVGAALAKLVKPQAAYQQALIARDAKLPALVKATSKLKRQAALVWEDSDPATLASIFAPPDAVQAPKSPAAKKAAKTKAGKKPPPPPPKSAPTNTTATTGGSTPAGSTSTTTAGTGATEDPEEP